MIFGGGVVAIVWAQQFLTSSLTSIIITTPFWFIVLDKSQREKNFRNGWIMTGLIVGLAGVLLLVLQNAPGTNSAIWFPRLKAILIIIGGSFLWVTGSLQIRNTPTKASPYAKTAVQLLAASLFAFLVSAGSGELASFQPSTLRIDAIVALVLLATISTTATFLAFIWLLSVRPASVVSTYAYVNPMVAVLLGVLAGGEHVSAIQIIAMFIILAGVLFTNIPQYLQKS